MLQLQRVKLGMHARFVLVFGIWIPGSILSTYTHAHTHDTLCHPALPVARSLGCPQNTSALAAAITLARPTHLKLVSTAGIRAISLGDVRQQT